jgi:Ubiquitin carboxyl-terminal hydrolase
MKPMKFPPIYFYHPNPRPSEPLAKELRELQLDIVNFFVENDPKILRINAIKREIAANPRQYQNLSGIIDPAIRHFATQIFSQLNQMRINLGDLSTTPLADIDSYLRLRSTTKKNLALVGVMDHSTLLAFDAQAQAALKREAITIEGVPKGIKNYNNSCYIAAVIQALLASNILKSKVMGEIVQREKEKPEEFAERQAIQKALQALIKEQPTDSLLTAFRQAIFANQFLNADLRKAGKKEDPTLKQQDAATLMMMLLSMIDCTFEREIRWWVEGQPKPDPIVKPSALLELDIKPGKNLQQLIEDHFAITPVTDPANKRRLTIGNKIYGEFEKWTTEERIKGGDVLVIQLKRFGNDLKKITDPVPFNENEPIDFSKGYDDGKKHLFKLVSAVRHNGSLAIGHYVAHVLHSGRWLEYNDDAIFPDAQVGKETARQNYLLIFEHCEKL